MAQVSLAELKARNNAPAVPASTEIGFSSVEGFQSLQRMANMFSSSSIVPDTFRGQVNLGNAAIALDMALRMHANPLMVMQSLYIVHGRPAWSAQFLIATLNKSGKFSALRYEFQGQQGSEDWGCRACAKELSTDEMLHGPLITIGLAKKEGWFSNKDKNGRETSKWQSMPELMLRYRAAAWFVRTYAPEIAMGLPEAEELHDTIDVTPEIESPEEAIESMETITKKAARSRAKKAETAVPAEPTPPVEVVAEEPAPAAVPKQAAQPEPILKTPFDDDEDEEEFYRAAARDNARDLAEAQAGH